VDHTDFTLQIHHTCLHLISVHQTAPSIWLQQLLLVCRPREDGGAVRRCRPMCCVYVVLTPTLNECGSGGVWTVKSSSGFVSPPSVGQVANDGRPWTPEAPCLLEFKLRAGQRLKVTLLDFTPRGGDVTSHVTSHAESVQSSSLSDTQRVSFVCLYSRRRHSREYSVDQPLWFCDSVRTIKPKRLKVKSPNFAQR